MRRSRSAWRRARSAIPDGSIVFRLDQLEVPSAWSQVAIDVLAQKYFRKAGVPARLRPVREEGVPAWLCRRVADERRSPSCPRTSGRSARPARRRCSTGWPEPGPIGAGRAAISQPRPTRAPSTTSCAACWRGRWRRPTRRNGSTPACYWAYGIDGPAQGHFYVDEATGEVRASASAYERPQPHACFIQSIQDDLVNEGGIMDLWVREARLFKYGSGTGTNFSSLRAENEQLSGGGRSSGLMSFLKIGDRAAGAIKSGGTTRRAAKMVIVDADHPDIESFIDWKVREEQKVAALVAGSRLLQRHADAIMAACHDGEASGADRFDPRANQALRQGGARGAQGAPARGCDPAGRSSTRARATPRSRCRPTPPTGTATPISPSPARTRTTRCASATSSSPPCSRARTGGSSGAPTARSPRR